MNPWTNVSPGPISRLALFGAHLSNDRTRGPANLRCSNCHEQNELTDASVRRITAAVNGPVRNRDGNVIDKGFNNIGIRPTEEDPGVGAADAFGPLSFARRLFPGALPEAFDGAMVSKGFGVEGAFKIPSLRNVALTAPYFYNGDARTLHEVVELYSRGGNVAAVAQLDGTPIEPLGAPSLSPEETDAVVAFLEALTDERVVYRRAPFDHPQLFEPNGHSVTTGRQPTTMAMALPTTCWLRSLPSVRNAASRSTASSRECSGRSRSEDRARARPFRPWPRAFDNLPMGLPARHPRRPGDTALERKLAGHRRYRPFRMHKVRLEDAERGMTPLPAAQVGQTSRSTVTFFSEAASRRRSTASPVTISSPR